jgi:uncharacterized protein YutE (UPF0331/DUF86 family)
VVEKESILKHLDELSKFLEDLQRYQAKISKGELLSNRDLQNMVLYAVIGAIQSCIDIGSHLIAELGLRRPERYRDVFRSLWEGKFLEEQEYMNLADLAGFRNPAIHIYWRVDFEEVYRVLSEEVAGLKKFAKKVDSLLKSNM